MRTNSCHDQDFTNPGWRICWSRRRKVAVFVIAVNHLHFAGLLSLGLLSLSWRWRLRVGAAGEHSGIATDHTVAGSGPVEGAQEVGEVWLPDHKCVWQAEGVGEVWSPDRSRVIEGSRLAWRLTI